MLASNSATTAKNMASMASRRSRTVCARTNSPCVRMLLTRNSGRARYLPAKRGCQHKRVGACSAHDERRKPDPAEGTLVVGRAKRNVGHRQYGPAHVAVAGVANQAHNLKATTFALI